MPEQTADTLPAAAPGEPAAPEPVTEDVPRGQFQVWLQEATASEPNDPNAMALATSTPDGHPSVRMVLLKGLDPRGFVFFTNLMSRKGGELAANPHAALLFYWKTLRRQVRIEGTVEPVSTAEADAYFATRGRVSRLGALASDQSRVLPSRAVLEARVAELAARFPGEDIPRPVHWSGYRVVPQRYEFWQDMPHRLHDRTIYLPVAKGWMTQKLYP